jgi:hypothetical protein
MLYLALYCTNTIILLINIFWEKMPEKWMTKEVVQSIHAF